MSSPSDRNEDAEQEQFQAEGLAVRRRSVGRGPPRCQCCATTRSAPGLATLVEAADTQEQRRQPGRIAPNRLVGSAEQRSGVGGDEEAAAAADDFAEPGAATDVAGVGPIQAFGHIAARNDANEQAPKTAKPHEPADIGDQY